MSGLREALEELAEWMDAATVGDGQVYAEPVAGRIRLILAAHPDDSVTEWGVQRDAATPSTSREAAVRTIERQAKAPKGWRLHSVLVSRQVTPWQVTE